jgi:hypothetical protein
MYSESLEICCGKERVIYQNAKELLGRAKGVLRGCSYSQDVGDEFENELVRFLRNHLMSVYSLIEARRVVMRDCGVDTT